MDDYYKVKALSNSSLSVLAESPEAFRARFVDDPPTMTQEETDAMRLGSAVHMLTLEPERFDERYAVLDGPINPSTGKPYGRDTKKFADWLASAQESEPRQIIIASEFADSMAIARSFQKHPDILAIMASKAEKIYELGYTFAVNGHPDLSVKCKPDCVIPELGIIIDLKTTQDPRPHKWCWSALDYGYHRQAAIYLDAMFIEYKKDFRFLFGVVRSKAPFEAAVYELSQSTIERGRAEYGALIDDYIVRRANNNWLADWQTGVQWMTLPERKTR